MAWFFIAFCIICLIVFSYGIMLHGASFFEKNIGEPLFMQLSYGGRKNYWKYVLVALPIFFIYKTLSRSPIWLMFYFILSYVGVGDTLIYQFIGFLIFGGAFGKVAEEGDYYFPKPTKEDKIEAAKTAKLFDDFYKALYPERYKDTPSTKR